MDTINVIDPSYGGPENPTDATGSLVSNQIKFKSESRQKIEGVARQFRELSRKGVEEQVEERMDNMSDREIAAASDVIADQATEVTKELTDDIIATPVDDMNAEFTKTIKEKSDYAKRLEARKEALEARDVEDYVSTLKPIKFENAKPLKIKAVHYNITHENGRKFSQMTEVEEKEAEFQGDITADTIVQEEPAEVKVEEVASANEEKIAEEVNNAMAEAAPEAVGFEPASNEMEEVVEASPIEATVAPETADSTGSITDIPEEELSIDYIRDEIDKIMNTKAEEDTKDVDLINSLEKETVEAVKEETPEEAVEEVEVTEVNPEEPVRELPEIVAEREAIIPIDINEKEEAIEPEEELQFDYSDVTEADVANTNSLRILEEMKKAKEKKLREKKEAEEKAEAAERELVLSFDEVEAMRRKAVESEKAVQQKMEEFDKYIKAYDTEIEDANKRREKAAGDREKNNKEIEDYKASIASNEDIERQLEDMMKQEEPKEEKDKKRR